MILCLLIIPVGIFVFSITSQTINTEVDTTYDVSFTVTDLTIDQILCVDRRLENILVKQVLSNGTVVLVDTTYWDYDLDRIIVNKTIL